MASASIEGLQLKNQPISFAILTVKFAVTAATTAVVEGSEFGFFVFRGATLRVAFGLILTAVSIQGLIIAHRGPAVEL